jgi:hypothetical protein
LVAQKPPRVAIRVFRAGNDQEDLAICGDVDTLRAGAGVLS